MKREDKNTANGLGAAVKPIGFAIKNGISNATATINEAIRELEKNNSQKEAEEIIDKALGDALDALDDEDLFGVQVALLELKPQLREKAGMFMDCAEIPSPKDKESITTSTKEAMEKAMGELKEAMDYARKIFSNAANASEDAVAWFKDTVQRDISDAISDYYSDIEESEDKKSLLDVLGVVFDRISRDIYDTIADYTSEVDCNDEDQDEEPLTRDKTAGYTVVVSYGYTQEKEVYFAETMKDAIGYMQKDFEREKAQDTENGKEIEESECTLTGAVLRLKSEDNNNVTYWDVIPAVRIPGR